jgi:uncharacterized protein
MIESTPNDPASMRINIPGLWMMTWYDASTAPNLAAYNYV